MLKREFDFQQLDVYHMGIVVEDVSKAVDTWVSTYGAGPFYHFSNHVEVDFRGKMVSYTENSAYGKFGRFAVELQNFSFKKEVPELQELLGTRPNTMNHAGFLTDDPASASKRLEAQGYPLFIHGQIGGSEFFWHDAREKLGHFIEVFLNRDIVRLFHQTVAEVSAGWDGTDPIRKELPPNLMAELGEMMHK